MARRASTETQKTDLGPGMLQATIDVFLDRTRVVTELMADAGGGALGRMPGPVPSAVTRMLSALRQLAEQAPSLTGDLHLLIEEVHAKRLGIQALQAELTALDHQLEVLERSLAPVEAWGRSWQRLQHTLAESLDLPQEASGEGP